LAFQLPCGRRSEVVFVVGPDCAPPVAADPPGDLGRAGFLGVGGFAIACILSFPGGRGAGALFALARVAPPAPLGATFAFGNAGFFGVGGFAIAFSFNFPGGGFGFPPECFSAAAGPRRAFPSTGGLFCAMDFVGARRFGGSSFLAVTVFEGGFFAGSLRFVSFLAGTFFDGRLFAVPTFFAVAGFLAALVLRTLGSAAFFDANLAAFAFFAPANFDPRTPFAARTLGAPNFFPLILGAAIPLDPGTLATRPGFGG
jgi:hypothetical protein